MAAFFPRSAGIPGLELDGFCVLHDRTLRSHDPRPLVEPGFGFAPIETRGASPPVLLWDHRSASWIVPSGSLGREYDFVAQLVGVEEIDLGDGALYVFACPAGCEMRAKYQR